MMRLRMMVHLVEPEQLSPSDIESIEKLSARLVYQAIRDFAQDAAFIFWNSPDNQTEVAEDCTREALEKLPGFPIGARIFGVMDYKRAGYVFLPELMARQALLVDSKAEKTGNVARLQVSQTSLPIRFRKSDGSEINEHGQLPMQMALHGHAYLTTTLFVHYRYEDRGSVGRQLTEIKVAALPNGALANIYVPNADETIWVTGPHSTSRNEAFRVRLSFHRLRDRCPWRVQTIQLERDTPSESWSVLGQWEED